MQIKEKLDAGKEEKDIADENFESWVRHYRAFREYRLIKTAPRNHAVEVIVCHGPTGTGKSKWAMESFPDAYWKQRSQWWDGYSNQATVILDEFYGWLPWDTLLRICDRYPLLVETKGGQVQFVAKTVVITTNAIPNTWYRNAYFAAFVRRVTEWRSFPVWGEVQSFSDYDVAMRAFVNV